MFGIYVSSSYDEITLKNMLEEYLYSKYPYLPSNLIHSIQIAFPSYKLNSYVVILNIEPDMVPEFNEQLMFGITIYPNLVCQHINVY